MNLDAFETLVRERRAVRHFDPRPLPEGVLARLLDAARWAPSGYNLQPTHFVVVTDPAIKERLVPACMGQSQVREAPAVVIFVGDRRVWENNFERVIAAEKSAGSISAEYERKLRQFVPLAFDPGPLGLGWLWKWALPPFLRRFRPVPNIPVAEKRYWLAKQALLSAMVFMLAAQAAGLATVPMEGFDESRVRAILGIPASGLVVLVAPVGYAADGKLTKTRLPLESMVHRERW